MPETFSMSRSRTASPASSHSVRPSGLRSPASLRCSDSSSPASTRQRCAPWATANASSVTSTAAQAGSALTSSPTNCGSPSTLIRPEPSQATCLPSQVRHWLSQPRRRPRQSRRRPRQSRRRPRQSSRPPSQSKRPPSREPADRRPSPGDDTPPGALRMRNSRPPRYAAIVMVALAVALVLPQASHRASAHAAQGRRPAPASVPVSARTVADVTSANAAAASGGLCGVPGIGDIGGLLGFCALGSSGLTGSLNNICQPSLPTPEPASSGIDAMVAPPSAGKRPATLYDDYGVAGDFWAATNLQCSDMTSLIGNNVAGMVFDAAKSIDRVTITVYQSAAGPGIVSWLQRVTDR